MMLGSVAEAEEVVLTATQESSHDDTAAAALHLWILKIQTIDDLNHIGVIKLPALIAASVLVPLRAFT